MKPGLVSLLVPDVGAPSLGAALRLADLLEPRHDVEIVGPDLGTGLCSMYRNARPVTAVPCPRLYRYPDFLWESRRLERALRGDLIVAVKAFMSTVAVALRRHRAGARVVVYLDEWDGSALAGLSPLAKALRRVRQAHHPLEDAHYPRVERMIAQADGVWSTTTFLQRRFGGDVLHMGVDTGRFRPQDPERVNELKRKLGLIGRRLVVFGGVVRPHKGVELILEAMVQLADPTLRLLVVGPVTDHLTALRADPRFHGLIAVAGAPPDDPAGVNAAIHAEMPLYLDLADLIVLPLVPSPLAESQMPIKLFEALAMAKPVIGSRVADLPRVLEGCGVVVEPGRAAAVASAMRRLLDDPAEARRLGEAARARCVKEFSQSAMRAKVADLVAAL